VHRDRSIKSTDVDDDDALDAFDLAVLKALSTLIGRQIGTELEEQHARVYGRRQRRKTKRAAATTGVDE